jgi:hypothetical protein
MTQTSLEILDGYRYHGANGDGVDGAPWDKSCTKRGCIVRNAIVGNNQSRSLGADQSPKRPDKSGSKEEEVGCNPNCLKQDAYDSRFSRQKNCRNGQGDEEKASDAKKKHLAPTKVKL